jgi:16S rRNA (adenine1518-N6/adenine1519-N6)-dimethyltransferase
MTNPYLSAAHVRAALRGLDMHPTRGMGQNFLVDAAMLEQIVAAAELSPADLVVEVGPGLGVLTWELLHRAGHVLAVELDKRLAARLHDEFQTVHAPPAAAKLTIIQADVLRLPPAAMVQQAPATLVAPQAYKVVANLPYAITSPVLRHFLEHPPAPVLIVVLVQWEVAQRITAAPGDLSLLAHAVQMYAVPEIVGRVPARSFVPAPAVDSAILRLHPRSTPAVAVDDIDALFRVIKAGFTQPRKKLRNALPNGLKSMGVRLERDTAAAALEAAGVDAERRAETVSLEEWAAIYRQLQQHGMGDMLAP